MDYLAFINLQMTYDMGDREALWQTLDNYRIDESLKCHKEFLRTQQRMCHGWVGMGVAVSEWILG